ncbi:MAG: MerR family transcriptional regulator [Desulfobacteraceae bacterium]|nr:MAG: MerR family transcriptional regulator [Desulfobacteraceae bacterium]
MEESNLPRKDIPDKLYFKIGEVSRIADLPASVLRFWETEFKQIQPKRTLSGQRLYRRQDVEMVLQIKDLLYKEKYTIKGAKEYLKSAPTKTNADSVARILDEVRSALEDIRKLLDR